MHCIYVIYVIPFKLSYLSTVTVLFFFTLALIQKCPLIQAWLTKFQCLNDKTITFCFCLNHCYWVCHCRYLNLFWCFFFPTPHAIHQLSIECYAYKEFITLELFRMSDLDTCNRTTTITPDPCLKNNHINL